MGLDLKIRPAQPEDASKFRALVERNAADMNIPARDADKRATEFLRSLDTPGHVFYVAYLRNLLVGFVIATRGSSHGRSDTYSLRVVVDKGFRGTGYGGQLVDAVLEHLDWMGVHRVEATPYVDGHDLARFWEIRGFALEGIKRFGARLLDGTHTHVAMLARVREEMA